MWCLISCLFGALTVLPQNAILGNPDMSYFGWVLAIAVPYKKDLGLGTLLATMLPCSLIIMPVGPGATTDYMG